MEFSLVEILTAVSSFIGGGWLISWYKAKPEKRSIEIENMSKTMDEMNKVIDAVKENASTYKEYTDSSIRELKKEVSDLTRKVEMKNKAIYSAYDCTFPEKASECPVLKTYRNCHDCADSIEQNTLNDE